MRALFLAITLAPTLAAQDSIEPALRTICAGADVELPIVDRASPIDDPVAGVFVLPVRGSWTALPVSHAGEGPGEMPSRPVGEGPSVAITAGASEEVTESLVRFAAIRDAVVVRPDPDVTVRELGGFLGRLLARRPDLVVSIARTAPADRSGPAAPRLRADGWIADPDPTRGDVLLVADARRAWAEVEHLVNDLSERGWWRIALLVRAGEIIGRLPFALAPGGDAGPAPDQEWPTKARSSDPGFDRTEPDRPVERTLPAFALAASSRHPEVASLLRRLRSIRSRSTAGRALAALALARSGEAILDLEDLPWRLEHVRDLHRIDLPEWTVREQALVALVFAEVHGLTPSALGRAPLERALRALDQARRQDGSWSDETSDTGFAILAAETAHAAGARVDQQALEAGRRWIADVASRSDDPAVAAIALACLLGRDVGLDDPAAAGPLATLRGGAEDATFDASEWFFVAEVAAKFPRDERTAWFDRHARALASAPPAEDDLEATALACLVLQRQHEFRIE